MYGDHGTLPGVRHQRLEWPHRQAGDVDLGAVGCALPEHHGLALRLVQLYERHERGPEPLAQPLHGDANQLLRIAHGSQLRGQGKQECPAIVRLPGRMHVSGRADPFRDVPSRPADGLRPAQMPQIGAIRAPQTSLKIQRLTGLQRVRPSRDRTSVVVGMDGRAGGKRAVRAGEERPQKLDSLPIKVYGTSVGVAYPDHVRQGVCEQLEVRRAGAALRLWPRNSTPGELGVGLCFASHVRRSCSSCTGCGRRPAGGHNHEHYKQAPCRGRTHRRRWRCRQPHDRSRSHRIPRRGGCSLHGLHGHAA